MHKTLFAGTVLYCAAALATNYYVDAENGDDGWTGTVPIESRVGTTGPKKSLKGAMEISGLKSGDVVWAAAGVYSNEVMTTTETIGSTSVTVKNRVVVPASVTLKATDGALKTFIVGEADETDPKWNGCGPDSVRCVFLGKKATLIGFTVTGGHAVMTSASAGALGGGISCDTPAYNNYNAERAFIDGCVISNNYAYAIGGGGCYGTYRRCRIVNNRVSFADNAGSNGSGVGYNLRCELLDCYVDGNSGGRAQVAGMKTLAGITFGPTGDPSFATRGDVGPNIKNSVFLKAPCSTAQYAWGHASASNCYFDDTITVLPDGLADEYRRPAGEFRLDAFGRPMRGSCLIDAGVNSYCTDLASTDIFGVPRLLNATVDVGAYEHDSRADYAAALDSLGDLSVPSCSSDVTLADGNVVRLAPDTSLDAVWRSRVEGAADFWMHVRVTGTGTLNVYVNGSASPDFTVVGYDGDRKLQVSHTGDLTLRFEYVKGAADGGGAEIFDFSQLAYANVIVADGGVSLVGVQPGINIVPADGTLSFSVRRAFDRATSVCTGVMSNGVYYAFDDYPNGLSFSVSGTLRGNVTVEAVYDDSRSNWYVDAVNGDDVDNYGLHPSNAFKTLAKVMSLATTEGNVVWALPGTYSDGTMNSSEVYNNESKVSLNRVVVPAGVTLWSVAGPEKTIILGAADSEHPIWYGCGTNSVRCAYLNKRAKLIGFTLTGGHARCDKVNGYEAKGGAVYVDESVVTTIADCIISNNTARSEGGGRSGTYIRCRITKNFASTIAGVGGNGALRVYDCYIGGNTGASQLYGPFYCVNSTVDGGTGNSLWNSLNAAYVSQFYNCVICGAPQTWNNIFFHRTAFNSAIPDLAARLAEKGDADCLMLTSAEMNLSSDGTPLNGSLLVDAGSNTYYNAQVYDAYVNGRSLPVSCTNGCDVVGTPRILGGRVDLGAYEYDWRDDFAADIGGRRVVVPTASQGVVETEASTVRLGDGDCVTLGWRPGAALSEREFFFKVADGTLTVVRNGETAAVLTSDGSWRCVSPTASDVFEFSFAGVGAAEILKSQGAGTALMFR